MPDPRKFIKQLKTRIKQNGYLILVTGNGGDICASDYPDNFFFPDHLVFAGEEHIHKLLSENGFTIIDERKYKSFLPEIFIIKFAKAIHGGHALYNKGSFRSLWFVAQFNKKENSNIT